MKKLLIAAIVLMASCTKEAPVKIEKQSPKEVKIMFKYADGTIGYSNVLIFR
jgi:hypothetical protein